MGKKWDCNLVSARRDGLWELGDCIDKFAGVEKKQSLLWRDDAGCEGRRILHLIQKK